jgi:antitoxin component HigA of HigAB toxin-antitoxin module
MNGVLIRAADPSQGAIYYNSTTGKQTPLKTGDALDTLNAVGTNSFTPDVRVASGALVPGAFTNFNGEQGKNVGGFAIPTSQTHYVTTPTGRFLSGGAGPDTTISANAYGYNQSSSPFATNPGLQTDTKTGQAFINPTSAEVMPGFWMNGGGAADVDYAANRNSLRNAFNAFKDDPQKVKDMMTQYGVSASDLTNAMKGGETIQPGTMSAVYGSPSGINTGQADINAYMQNNAATFGAGSDFGGQHIWTPQDYQNFYGSAGGSSGSGSLTDLMKSPSWMSNANDALALQKRKQDNFGTGESWYTGKPGYAEGGAVSPGFDFYQNAYSPAPAPSMPSATVPVTPTGGMTPEQNASISAFFYANQFNPQAIITAMQQYGVSTADLANAIGQSPQMMAGWLDTAKAASHSGSNALYPEDSPVGSTTYANDPNGGGNYDSGGSQMTNLATPALTSGTGSASVSASDTASPTRVSALGSNDPGYATQQAQFAAQAQFASDANANQGSSSGRMSPEQNTNIVAFWNANQGNPQAIINSMNQYGVNANDIANATGQTPQQVAAYLQNNGAPIGFGGVTYTTPSGTPGMTTEQNTDIAAFWNANKGDPKAVQNAMNQYGVSAAQLASATGQTPEQVAAYLSAGGAPVGFGGISPQLGQKNAAGLMWDGTSWVPDRTETTIPISQTPAPASGPSPIAGPLTASLTDLGATPNSGPTPNQPLRVTDPATPALWSSGSSANSNFNPIVNGVSTAPTGNKGPLSNIWNPAPTVQGGYNTPVLDSLYSNMQQGFGGPKPTFNFQSKPAFKNGGVVGALTRVIKHGI